MNAIAENKYPISKYDNQHDVLHLFLGSQRDSSADEEFPGVYVNRNDDTEMIVGFTIMDFSRNREHVKKMYPQYDFHAS